MKPILRVYNPAPIDRIDVRSVAQTGQVVSVVSVFDGQALIKTPDDTGDLGMVAQSSLVPLPKRYKFDPNTGLNRETIC